MSFANAGQIRQLQGQSQNFPNAAHKPGLPRTFLSLAPTVSQSYPTTQKSKQVAMPTAISTDVPAEASPSLNTTGTVDAPKRRASSLESDDQSPISRRYLKLGPVHWGEHQEEHQADFHEVAVE